MSRLLALLLSVCMLGCGGFLSAGRAANETAAQGLAAVDRELAPAYAHAAGEALADSESLEEYERVMTPWNEAEEALRASHEALKVFQAALDAYEAGSEGDVLRATLKVLEALDRLAGFLVELGLEAVGEVHEVLTDLRQFFRQPGSEDR